MACICLVHPVPPRDHSRDKDYLLLLCRIQSSCQQIASVCAWCANIRCAEFNQYANKHPVCALGVQRLVCRDLAFWKEHLSLIIIHGADANARESRSSQDQPNSHHLLPVPSDHLQQTPSAHSSRLASHCCLTVLLLPLSVVLLYPFRLTLFLCFLT